MPRRPGPEPGSILRGPSIFERSSSPGLVRNCALGPGDPVFRRPWLLHTFSRPPRRTGSPAFAEDDGGVGEKASRKTKAPKNKKPALPPAFVNRYLDRAISARLRVLPLPAGQSCP